MVLVYLKKPVLLHFTQLIGQGASVHAQIICQLLAVEGNREFTASLGGRLEGKVGQKPSAD